MTEPYKTPGATDTILRDRTAKRAHDLWDGAGRPDGRGTEFWTTAQAEVKIELKAEIDYSDPLRSEGFSR